MAGPAAPARLSLSLPPGGPRPLHVGLVAVGACFAVVGMGALIRAITHGGEDEARRDVDRAARRQAGRPESGRREPAAVAALFDPFADEPPAGETVRDDVLIRHRGYYRRLADASEALVSLFRDGRPARPGASQAKEVPGGRVAEIEAGRAGLPSPTPAEEYRLLVECAGRLIDVGNRQKAEIRRVLATLPDGSFRRRAPPADGPD